MRPIYEAPQAGDIRDSLADISRAGEAFGYDPQYLVEEGLRQAMTWFHSTSLIFEPAYSLPNPETRTKTKDLYRLQASPHAFCQKQEDDLQKE